MCNCEHACRCARVHLRSGDRAVRARVRAWSGVRSCVSVRARTLPHPVFRTVDGRNVAPVCVHVFLLGAQLFNAPRAPRVQCWYEHTWCRCTSSRQNVAPPTSCHPASLNIELGGSGGNVLQVFGPTHHVLMDKGAPPGATFCPSTVWLQALCHQLDVSGSTTGMATPGCNNVCVSRPVIVPST